MKATESYRNRVVRNIVQNQPRDKWWRELFIAPKGKVLIVRDYSQIELRVLAIESEDPVLLDEYKRDVDVHMNNGRLVAQALGVNWASLTDAEKLDYRKKAKNSASFGVIYGMGARSLAATIGVSEEDAEALIFTIFSKYKIVDQWIKRVHHTAAKQGYVTTMFGRRRDIPQVLSSDKFKMLYGLRQAVNSKIQGAAADLVKMALREIYNNARLKELGFKLLMQVHDELIGEVPEENAVEANELVKKCMSDFAMMRKLPISFPSDGGIGKNWHEAKEAK